MTSKSPKQAKTMSAIAHGWHPPKGSKVAHIPRKVAKEFHAADAGKKYGPDKKGSPPVNAKRGGGHGQLRPSGRKGK